MVHEREGELTVSNNSTTSNKYILAIDLGTSGPKAAIVSTLGEVLDYEFQDNPKPDLSNGGAEQNPDDWWEAIGIAVRTVMGRGAARPEQIASICVTTQWSGTVAVDENGDHLMNAIIWMDSRGEPYVRDICGGSVAGYNAFRLPRWLRLTGGMPTHSGKDPIAHILYIKNELPEVYRATHKFLEPKDYINLRLTGRFASSYDSIALHWVTDNRNLAKVKYEKTLLKWSTIDAEKLPELKQAVDILGPITAQVAHEWGLSQETPVVMGTPDIQSAAIGSGAVRDYQGHLYIGTSSWLTCHVPFKKTDVFHNMATLPSAIPLRYFIANEQEMAGECMKFLRDNILFRDDELSTGPAPRDVLPRMNRLAQGIAPGSDKMLFLPWLMGERTPIEDHHVRGGFYNMRMDSTRAHMVRAVMEGVAYNSRWLLGYLEKFIKRPMAAINIIGGGAVSDLWCQIQADVSNRAIRRVKDPIQANVRGAGFLASVAMGYQTFDEIADRVLIDRVFEPNPDNRKIYDELFREFVNVYKQNRKIFARLNRVH